MPIAVTSIVGCCNGRNFFNLGGAHAYRVANNQDEFNDWMYAKVASSINIAITNSIQDATRRYLEACGWKTDKVGLLWISTISGADFNAWKNKVGIEIREKRKKLEEERIRHLHEVQTKTKFAPSGPKIYTGKILEEDIRRLCPNGIPHRNNQDYSERCREALQTHYSIRLLRNFYTDSWGQSRNWSSLRRLVYKRVSQTKQRAQW